MDLRNSQSDRQSKWNQILMFQISSTASLIHAKESLAAQLLQIGWIGHLLKLSTFQPQTRYIE